jgi:RHS repeat-associated protein
LDESNLEYLNARYYSPTQGQFISQDPSFLSVGDPGLVKQVTGRDQQMFLADPQLANSYSYGRDNPITQKDPDGKIVPLILGIVAVYSWAQVGVDAYDAYNTNVKYGAIFGVEEKNRTNGKLLYDAGTSVVGGVASIPKIGLKLLGDSLSLLTASMDILDQYGSQQIYGPYNEVRAKQNERAAKKESAVSTPKSGLNWSALNVRNTAQSVATRGSSGTQSWWTVTVLPSTVTQNGVTYVRNSSGLLNSTNSK